MSYRGDYAAGVSVNFKFTTRRFSSGAPFALSSGTLAVYKDNSTASSTAGITLTSTFASVVGMNHVEIATTADSTFYADGSQFEVVLSQGEVDSVSVAGEVIGRFNLRAVVPANVTQFGGSAGTFSGGRPEVNATHINGSTIGTTSAQVGVNVVTVVGATQAAVNLGAQLDVTVGSRLASTDYTAALGSTGIRDAVGLASANLDTQLQGLTSASSGIKAKTDSLTFTVAGHVDANIQYVNDVQVSGAGSTASPWGPV